MRVVMKFCLPTRECIHSALLVTRGATSTGYLTLNFRCPDAKGILRLLQSITATTGLSRSVEGDWTWSYHKWDYGCDDPEGCWEIDSCRVQSTTRRPPIVGRSSFSS